MASLAFDGVGKTYTDGTVAVANVSFTIANGEFVVLVGPSGCGNRPCCAWPQGWSCSTAAG